MAINRELKMEVGNVKFALIRRDPATLFADIPEWIKKLDVKEFISAFQTESNGNITLSLFYR